MPEFFSKAPVADNLMDAKRSRPPSRQNDYIGWIQRAKLETTKQKRLAQMLEEHKRGNVYMKTNWKPR